MKAHTIKSTGFSFVLEIDVKVSLCVCACLPGCSVDQAGLDLRDSPAPLSLPNSQVLELQACATTAWHFKVISNE